MATKRKFATGLVAGVISAALLLGGTFAWTSISQAAKNESAGVVNVGGRLHDDFNGETKAVYVENFTDPFNGGQPIYARVRLDEYMEIGQDAGGVDDGDGIPEAVPVVSTAQRDNVDTWTPHVPAESCEVCATEGTCKIHDHWQWTMGGATTFMPTFNKDKDSLAADINGTYAGTDPNDKVYYDDYVVYTTDENGEGVGIDITEDAKEAHDGPIYSVIGSAQYDDDTDTEENTTEGSFRLEEETHTAKETVDGTVITMDQWINDYDQTPGNYWVYDIDGWAYWANPIMPGQATGLLLNGIEMFKNPGEKCYYAINVVGQFATAGDWEKFGVDEEDVDYPSDDALQVLITAAANVPNVSVTNTGNVTMAWRNGKVTFSADTTIGELAVSPMSFDEYDWVVLNEDRKIITTSTVVDNGDGTVTLTVGAQEMSPGLYVAACSKQHPGAVGLSPVAVKLYTVSVSAADSMVNAGKTLQLRATVEDSSTGEAETSGVTWTVDGGSGTTAIDGNGLLTVDSAETDGAVLTVTATSNNGGFTGTCTVTVLNKYSVAISAPDAYVDPGKTLELSAEVRQNDEIVNSGVDWKVDGGSGTTAISESGELTVDANETGGTVLTVTATSLADERAKDTFTVTVNQYAVTLTAAGDATEVIAGYPLQFNAAVTKNGASDTSGVTWKVDGGSGSTAIEADGTLSVAKNETGGAVLTVTATSVNDPKVSATYKVTVAQYAVTVSEKNDANTVDAGKALDFNADVTKNGASDTSGVTWSVENGTGSTNINENGILTIDQNETRGATLTVKATSKADTTVVDTVTVTVNRYAVTVTIPNAVTTVDAGGTLDFTATVYKNGFTDDGNAVNWSVSGGSASSIDSNGKLTVGAGERRGTTLTVKATSKEDNTASGTWTVKVNTYTVSVSAPDTYVDPSSELQFTAAVTKNNATDSSGVTWSVTGSGASVDSNGKLTVAASATGGTTFTVKATSKVDNTASGTWTVTVNKYTVSISAAGNAEEVDAGKKLQFTATVTKNGVTDSSGVNWSCSAGIVSISGEGLLTVYKDAEGGLLTITATSVKDPNVKATYDVTIIKYVVTVSASLKIDADSDLTNPATAYAADVLTFTADVKKNGVTDTKGVTWSVSGGTVSSTSSGQLTLTVPASLAHGTKLTVTAKSQSNSSFSDTYTFTVYDGWTRLNEIEAGSLEMVKIDGMRWYKLVAEGQKALIWAAQTIPGVTESFFADGYMSADSWEDSTVRSYLNEDFAPKLDVLKTKMRTTELSTASDWEYSTFDTTNDKVFLLTQADIFGTKGAWSNASDKREYTLGKVGIIVENGMKKSIDGEDSWLRSPWHNPYYMPVVTGDGTVVGYDAETKLRPAMWVNTPAKLELRLYYNNDFNTVSDTVKNGDSKETILANSYSTQIRVYDENGNWITPAMGAKMTFWINGTDVTGGGLNCTNGADETNGHWWAWVGSDNDGTKVTIKVTYNDASFEATIW